MADNNESQVFDAEINFTTSGVEDALADAGALDDLMQSLADGVTATVDVAIEGDDFTTLEDLDSTTYNPSVEPTVDSEEVDSLEALDGETITPEVAPETTSEGKSLLTTLHELGVNPVQVVMNIAGTAVDFIATLGRFTITPFLDLEDTVAKFNAQTGTAIPNARELFQSILNDDLGESIEQVGKVATKAAQLHLPIDEATRAALTFTHTWTEEDPSTVIETLGVTVSTKLVPNLQEAADLLSVFYQQNGNAGGDAQQVIRSNAQEWADAGLTLQQALSFISSFQQGTGATATEAAKAFQTLDDALTTAAADPQSKQAEFLRSVGLDNPKDLGGAMGADFIDGFVEKFTTLPADQQDLAAGLFFGKGGKKFTGAIEGVTTDFDPYKDYKDAAETAATEIDNSLRGVIDDFVTAINARISELLSSDAIDLPGKIEALKTGLQDALDVLTSGGSIQDAITVGLKPIGFDDEFQRLEAIFGDLIINLLGIVASIQETFGGPDGIKAAAATRATQAQYSATQLAFKLKIDNPDEVARDVTTAITRGVTPSQVSEAIGTAVSELVKSGAVEQAQAILDTVQANSSGIKFQLDPSVDAQSRASIGQWLTNNGLGTLNADGSIDLAVTPDMSPEAQQSLIDQVKNGLTYDKYTITPTITEEDKAALQKEIDDTVKAAQPPVSLTTGQNALGIGFGAEGQGGLTSGAADGLTAGIIDATAKAYADATPKAKDYHDTTELIQLANTDAGQSFIDMMGYAQQAAEGVEDGSTTMVDAMEAADRGITDSISGNSINPELESLGETALDVSERVVAAFKAMDNASLAKVEANIDDMIYRLQLLVAQIGAAETAATSAASAGGNAGSTGKNTTTNNNNVTINTTSNAQATAAGQVTVNGLTGRAV